MEHFELFELNFFNFHFCTAISQDVNFNFYPTPSTGEILYLRSFFHLVFLLRPSPPSLTKYFHSPNIFFSSAGQIFPSFSPAYILQIFTSFSFEGKILSFSKYFSPFPSLFFFSSMVKIFSFSRYLFSSFSFSVARGRVRV